MRAREGELFVADFRYVREHDVYVHLPTKEIYTADEIDRLFPPVPELTEEPVEGSIHS